MEDEAKFVSKRDGLGTEEQKYRKLAEENRVLREALDAMSTGFIVFDADDRIVAFNKKQLELFPSVAENLVLGMSYQSLLEAQTNKGQIDAARGREKMWIEEWMCRHQKADGIPLEQKFDNDKFFQLTEHRTPSGGIVAVRSDITKRKEMETALGLTQFSVDHAGDAIYWIGVDGKFEYANQYAKELLGFEWEEFEEIHIWDLDHSVNSNRWSIIWDRLQNTERQVFQTTLLTKTGVEVQVEVTTFPVVYGDRQLVCSYSRDITKRKKAELDLANSERRYRELMEGSVQGVLITTIERKPLVVNDKCAEIFGYGSIEEILALESTRQLIAPHELSRLDKIRRPYEAGETTDAVYYEFEGVKKDGTFIWLEVFAKAVNWDERPAAHLTLVDVTNRKRMEADLQDALVDAERANRSKSEFLATMSHEFRTPLNAILGFSEMLRAQYFGPLGARKYTEYAADIHNSGEHMLALVNDVLDIATIEAGKRPYIKSEILLEGLLRNCIKSVEPIASEKSIKVLLDVPRNMPLLYADKRSATQILQNLLSNAVKFSEPGGVISVSTASAGDEITISVIDTGIGISADYLPKITEPFSQAVSDPYRAQEGTGLGLSIVSSLVDAHGGKLEIESEVGKGTAVTVAFPLRSPSNNQ